LGGGFGVAIMLIAIKKRPQAKKAWGYNHLNLKGTNRKQTTTTKRTFTIN
jgi:hypothetical protein